MPDSRWPSGSFSNSEPLHLLFHVAVASTIPREYRFDPYHCDGAWAAFPIPAPSSTFLGSSAWSPDHRLLFHLQRLGALLVPDTRGHHYR